MRAVLPFLVLLSACPKVSDQSPQRSCESAVRFSPLESVAGEVQVAGEWNAFSPQPMVRQSDNTFVFTGTFGPRDYAYRFVLPAEKTSLDDSNAFRRWVGNTEYSRLRVPDCKAPLVEVTTLSASAAGAVELTASLFRGSSGSPLQPVQVRFDGDLVTDATVDAATGALTWSRAGVPVGKHAITIELSDEAGLQARRLYLPFWVEATPYRWDGQLLYFTFTDRFRNGDPANDKPASGVKPIANYQGGDFKGIRQAIEEGYFEKLGVTALWLSPLDQNPDEGMAGSFNEKYTGYHGYWPSAARTTQSRFGSLDELRALTTAAHDRGMRVIADLVLNHTHDQHPYFVEHKNDGWYRVSGSCVCGTNNCSFDARPLDCWFAPYLPDYDWKNPAMAEQFVTDSLWWLENADLDGFRLDAVKHLEHVGGRNVAGAVNEIADLTGTDFYLVGETFTGSEGRAQISEYVGPHELDGQFDFPLYWPIVDTFAKGGTFVNLDNAVKASASGYPTGALMSPFLGNHDVARFSSTAAGQIGNDAAAQAWNSPPPGTVTDDAAFRRQRDAFAFLLTQPGVPLIYYGDEYGLPGAGDPDNRRMMKWAGLTTLEQTLRGQVEALGTARKASPALQRGVLETVMVEAETYVYKRTLDTEVAFIAINRGAERTVSVSGHQTGANYREVLSGRTQAFGTASQALTLPAASAQVWVLQR